MAQDSNFAITRKKIAEASASISAMLNSQYAKYYKPELTNGLKDMRKFLTSALDTASRIDKEMSSAR